MHNFHIKYFRQKAIILINWASHTKNKLIKHKIYQNIYSKNNILTTSYYFIK
jgi:hypothetical protein